MLRKVIAVLVGLAAAMAITKGFEAIQLQSYPLPAGTDPGDHAAAERYVESLPTQALLIVAAGWAVAALVCGLLVRVISRSGNTIPAYLAGLFLTSAGIVTVFTLPYPVWYCITGVVIFIPLTLAGHWLGGLVQKN